MVCFFLLIFRSLALKWLDVEFFGFYWACSWVSLSASLQIWFIFSYYRISPSICQISSFQTLGRQILDLAVLQALSLCSIIQFASFLSVVVGLHLLFCLQVHQFFLVASILTLCQLFNFLCLLDFMSLYPYWVDFLFPCYSFVYLLFEDRHSYSFDTFLW